MAWLVQKKVMINGWLIILSESIESWWQACDRLFFIFCSVFIMHRSRLEISPRNLPRKKDWNEFISIWRLSRLWILSWQRWASVSGIQYIWAGPHRCILIMLRYKIDNMRSYELTDLFFCLFSEGDHSVRGQSHYLSEQPEVPHQGLTLWVSLPACACVHACTHMGHKKPQPLHGFTAGLVIFSAVVKDQDQNSEMRIPDIWNLWLWGFLKQGCLSSSDSIRRVFDVDVLKAWELKDAEVFLATRRLSTLKHSDTSNTFSKAEIYQQGSHFPLQPLAVCSVTCGLNKVFMR